jgi:hypothetical protein
MQRLRSIFMLLALSLIMLSTTHVIAAGTIPCVPEAGVSGVQTFPFATQVSYNPDIQDLLNKGQVFAPGYTATTIKPFSDIRLENVTFGGKTITGMQYVSGANIIQNNFDDKTGADATGYVRKPWWVINTGRGHNTAFDPYVTQSTTSGENGATPGDMVAAYANRNMTNINYNRERGSLEIPAVFEISFPYSSDTFFVWERGWDSHVRIEFMDESGLPVAIAIVCWQQFDDAGYNIQTDTGFNWPIGNAQRVASKGFKTDVPVKTLRFTIHHNEDFGPDLKVMALPQTPQSAMVLLKEASDLVNSLDESAFKASDSKQALTEKLGDSILTIAEGGYTGASMKLTKDILPKIGSCEQPSKKDFLVCPATNMQKMYLPTIHNLIAESNDLLEK